MRILSLLFLTFFLGKSCSTSKKDIETAVIIYEANTKGYYGKVIVKNHAVSVSRQRGDEDLKTKRISDADWNYLVDEFKKVDLNSISKLKAPSDKRFYDGAAAATVNINYKGKEYVSSPFDHGNPPAEIKNLVSKIVSFINGN